MKKNFLLVGLLTLGVMAFQSCKKNENIGVTPVDPDLTGKMEKLTPSESKTRLQDVGLEFVKSIEAETHENLVEVVAYIDEEYGRYDIDEDYIDQLEQLYKESGYDEEYYAAVRRSNPVGAIRDLMAMSLGTARSGAQLATRAERIYMSTLKAGLKDLYGGFKPDEQNELWMYDKNVTDRLEVEFVDSHNQKWVATLKGSKETTRIHVTVYDKNNEKEVFEGGPDNGTSVGETWIYDDEYTLDVPKEITFTVKCNGDAVVDMTVNSSLAFDWAYNEESESIYYRNWYESDWYYDGGYYEWGDYDWNGTYSVKINYTNLNLDAKLVVNGYEETFKSDATKSGIFASAGVKINGKSMLKAEASLNADIDNIIKQINDAAKEEDEDDINVNANAVKDFSMYIDVMGKVQIVGKCDKFEDLYDAVVDLEEADYENDFAKFERNLDQLNGAYSVTVHYDNTQTVQAKIELEAHKEVDEWDGYTYFWTTPVLVFTADNTRYSFEEYFTESSFSSLVEAVEDLGEDFERLFDRYF